MAFSQTRLSAYAVLFDPSLSVRKSGLIYSIFTACACASPESFVRGGPSLKFFFLADGGIEDPNTALIGPSSAR